MDLDFLVMVGEQELDRKLGVLGELNYILCSLVTLSSSSSIFCQSIKINVNLAA